MSAAPEPAVGPDGPSPAAVLDDLPDAVWSALLPLVRATLDQVHHTPRRLRPFAGWRPDKFDGSQVRGAVSTALARDARFRVDLGDHIAQHHPALAEQIDDAGAARLVDDHGVGPVAALLIGRDRWQGLSVVAARVAESQVHRAADVAAEPGATAPGDDRGDRPDEASEPAVEEIRRLQRRVRRLEADAARMERQLRALRADLERARQAEEQVTAERDDLSEQIRDLQSQQRTRLNRYRRQAREARSRAQDAEQRVAVLADDLGALLGRLTSPGATDSVDHQVSGHTATEPRRGGSASAEAVGEPEAARAVGGDPSAGTASAAVPRGVRPARPGRPCTLPPGVVSDTPEAVQALLQVDGLRLILDGYNVSKDLRGRPTAPLTDQRLWLVKTVAGAVAGCSVRPVVVFDAADGSAAPSPTTRRVRVVFTSPGELADDWIAAYVDGAPPTVPVCVVTSDREVREAAADRDVDVVSSGVFLQGIGASS